MTEQAPQKTRARILDAHRVIGALFAGLFALVCLSGTYSLIEHQFERMVLDSASSQEPADEVTKHFSTIQQFLDTHVESAEEVTVEWPIRGRVGFAQRPDQEDKYASFDTRTGELLEKLPEGPAAALTEFHHNFLVPGEYGHVLVGMAGIYALILIVTGVWLHIVMRKPRTREGREASARVTSTRWHRTMGWICAPIAVIVILSGASLGLGSLTLRVGAAVAYEGDFATAIEDLFGEDPDETVATPTPEDRVRAFEVLERRIGDGQIRFVTIEDYQLATETIRVIAHTAHAIPMHDIVKVQSTTGQILSNRDPTASVGHWWVGILAGIHFGLYGGVIGSIGYLMVGWILGWLALLGLQLGAHHRRHRQPRLSQLYQATFFATGLVFPIVAAGYLTGGFLGVGAEGAVWLLWAATGLAVALACVFPSVTSPKGVSIFSYGAAVVAFAMAGAILCLDRGFGADRTVVAAQAICLSIHLFVYGFISRRLSGAGGNGKARSSNEDKA